LGDVGEKLILEQARSLSQEEIAIFKAEFDHYVSFSHNYQLKDDANAKKKGSR